MDRRCFMSGLLGQIIIGGKIAGKEGVGVGGVGGQQVIGGYR